MTSVYNSTRPTHIETETYTVWVDYSTPLLNLVGKKTFEKERATLSIENKQTGTLKVSEHLLHGYDVVSIANIHRKEKPGKAFRMVSEIFNQREQIATY